MVKTNYKFLFFLSIIILTGFMLSLEINHDKKINKLCSAVDYLFSFHELGFYSSDDMNSFFSSDEHPDPLDPGLSIYQAVKIFNIQNENELEICMTNNEESVSECILNGTSSVYDETAHNFESYKNVFNNIYRICGEEPSRFQVLEFISNTSRLKDDMESFVEHIESVQP